MSTVLEAQPKIIRTERGLTISGTRITLYDVMDYVTAQYPPKFIQAILRTELGDKNAVFAEAMVVRMRFNQRLVQI